MNTCRNWSRPSPTRRAAPERLRSAARLGLAAAALSPAIAAQQSEITYSIDFKSRSIARPDANGHPMTEADLLRRPTNSANLLPTAYVTGDKLGLQQYSPCVGHQPATDCDIEFDSLSSGQEPMLLPNQLGGPGSEKRRIYFSVDEWAAGHPLTATAPPHPTVRSEGNPGVPAPAFEASADVFVDVNLPSGPLGPTGGIPNNVGAFDGNGAQSANGFSYPGLGLLEPNNTNSPHPPPPPYTGDNVDALDLGPLFATGTLTYLSLDSAFLDRLNLIPNSGSAVANGFRGGDVIKIPVGIPGTVLSLYAPAGVLGLDLHGAPDSDDLDALILHDNGDGIYQPSQAPYDWLLGGTDMLLFSVRRGSAVIGHPDSIFGAPIEPGDLLIPPVAGGNGNPGIFIAAERLGLRTVRSNGGDHGDDLDAAAVRKAPYFDCNENGVEDSVDIAWGTSADANGNGVPDECEDKVVEHCKCALGAPAPCLNHYAGGGCKNSTGVGAILASNISSGGSVSIANDDLILTGTQVPPNVSGIFFMGSMSKPPIPFQDGIGCIKAPVFRYALQNAGSSATFTLGPGICATAAARFGVPGTINAEENWYFQVWYRDPSGPCGKFSNVTNVVKVTFDF